MAPNDYYSLYLPSLHLKRNKSLPLCARACPQNCAGLRETLKTLVLQKKKKNVFAADTGHKHRVAVGFQRADGLLIRQLIAARQGTERNPAVFGEGFCR